MADRVLAILIAVGVLVVLFFAAKGVGLVPQGAGFNLNIGGTGVTNLVTQNTTADKRIVNVPSAFACPPGTTDQTDWKAIPVQQPDGALRYPHKCE